MLLKVITDLIKSVAKKEGGSTEKTLSEAAGELTKAVGKSDDLVKLVKAKEDELTRLLCTNREKEMELRLEAMRSEDPYVRRARPTFLWLFYLVIGVNFVIFPVLQMLGADPPNFGNLKLPEELYWLFGSSYLGYGAYRSFDKNRKLSQSG